MYMYTITVVIAINSGGSPLPRETPSERVLPALEGSPSGAPPQVSTDFQFTPYVYIYIYIYIYMYMYMYMYIHIYIYIYI